MRDESLVGRRPAIPFSCLPHLLEHHAKRIPDAPAILAPGRVPLTYSQLHRHLENTEHTLRAMGIGRHDRIVVVLPNGPEMAVAILAAAASAVCAPMNPAYQAEELDRYFAHLRPRALIIQAGTDSPARRVALSRGVGVIELSAALDAEAGLFTLTGDRADAPSHELVRPGHVAVLLLTSGTTARPKIVPQTHANICASAYSSVAAWALSETDRCINMLPLFHGHGLHNTVMASLAAGASVVCTPGWDVNGFFAWLTAFQPTWYSAVSTIHQAILAQARHSHERLADCRLRFIRSGSAPLPSRVLMELESTFEAPVIEYYAMTETTSTPIACNPFPPARRKAGSAGIPVSLDVAIMDEGGALLANGRTGEVVVRGAGVMPGYDGDPIATTVAFAGDWFKTGDLGFFDDEGYLFLAGRVREIINRGGEKIAPQEVDEVLLEHPAVAEAVTFAVPHATLGEDVASAIVLRSHGLATPKEVRQFAIGRIADFKVPRQVLIVDKIPKGPTGKVQRIGLASKLGLAATTTALPRAFVAPRTPLETLLAKRWAEILQLERIGIHDDFFASGGDSLLATRVLGHIYEVTKIEFEASRFFAAPTVAEVAQHLEQVSHAGQAPRAPSTLVRAARENGVMPASIAQEHLCKLQHALPDIPCFNILYALRITSPCDVAVLERSINEIVRRHEILRTTFAVVDGRHLQVIAPQLTVPLAFDDLHALPASRRQTVGHQLIQDELLHCFDLAQGPLFRARLVRLAEREHLLVLSTHQVLSDGWSSGVLANELAALYDAFSSGAEASLPPLSIQFADFAFWQRRWQSHPDMIAQLAYWREQLRDPLPVMKLAKRRSPRRTIDALRTARREWVLPAGLAEAAKRFAHQEGGTLFMALVAALKTLLHRYLAQDDLRVATLVANRNRPGTEGLIGPLANTVILRTSLAGDPNPLEVMRRVRVTTLAAYAHQDLPFEELVETLEHGRSRRSVPLSEVMLTLHNASLRPIMDDHTLTLEEANPGMPVPLVTITPADVIFMLHETAHGLAGRCVYKPHLFNPETIDRLLRDFEGVLEQMVAQPERPISTIRIARNPNRRSREDLLCLSSSPSGRRKP